MDDFKLNLGAGCPLNVVTYNDDSDSWTGMYEVPHELVWKYGASGLDDIFTDDSGNADTRQDDLSDRENGPNGQICADRIFGREEGIERLLPTSTTRLVPAQVRALYRR